MLGIKEAGAANLELRGLLRLRLVRGRSGYHLHDEPQSGSRSTDSNYLGVSGFDWSRSPADGRGRSELRLVRHMDESGGFVLRSSN